MTTRSIHDTVRVARALQAQTITTSALNTGNLDLRGFDSALFDVDIGAIDGLGSGSPTGGSIQVLVQHADDDGTGAPGAYANVADTDLDGATQSSGVVHTFDEDNTAKFTFGYVGSKRFVKITLTPSGLGAGGPIYVTMVNGHAHLQPVTQG